MINTDVVVDNVWLSNYNNKFKANIEITIGGVFKIRDIKIIQGSSGEFVGYPSKSYKTKEGETKYMNLVELIDDEAKKTINQIILSAYRVKQNEKTIDYQDRKPPQATAPVPKKTDNKKESDQEYFATDSFGFEVKEEKTTSAPAWGGGGWG